MRVAAWVVATLAACGNGRSEDACLPQLDYQSPLTIVEGTSITFDLALLPSSPCEGGGELHLYAQSDAGTSGGLRAEPLGFSLTRAAPRATFTLYAGLDADAMNDAWTMEMYLYGAIGGESPETMINIIEAPP